MLICLYIHITTLLIHFQLLKAIFLSYKEIRTAQF
nr:MAG TPA: hypothetical protein [Caudoviricetes sp.]